MSQTLNTTNPKENQSFDLDLLGLWNAIRKRRKLCATAIGVSTGLALLYSLFATPIYLANSRMLVEPGSLKITSIQEVYDTQATRDPNARRDFLATQMKLMTSEHILARVYEHFDFSKRPGFEGARDPLALLADRIEIRQVPNTNLIDIGFKDEDPKFSALVSNYVAQEYINDSRARSSGFSERGLDLLREELVSMEKERFKAIDKLNDFKAQHDMLSAETTSALLISKLTELGNALITARESVANAQASVDAVEAWKAQGLRLDSIPEASNSITLANFKTARLQAQAALVKSLQDFGPNHRTVTTQKRVIAEMDKAIQDETDNILVSIRAKLEAAQIRLRLLEQENTLVTKELQDLDRISDEYKVLEDKLKASEKAYQYVLERVSELQIAKNADSGSGGTFQIIVPASPPESAAYPQRLKLLVLVFILSALGSVLLSLILEFLDVTIKNRDEFEKCSRLPIYGEIPQVPKTPRSDFICFDSPKSTASEAFSALRTSLSLSQTARKAKLITVTSSKPNEGKSFISLNLAITYARSGKRVLLVDADMRRNRLTRLLAGENINVDGLSNLLAGTVSVDALPQTVIRPFENLKLDFLTSGPLPANPVELISGAITQITFGKFEEAYDMVIVDTPPVLLVSDTANLSAIHNMHVLIVGQLHNTEKKELSSSVHALERVGAKVVGLVIQHSQDSVDNARYDYGYQYAYTREEPPTTNKLTDLLTQLHHWLKSKS